MRILIALLAVLALTAVLAEAATHRAHHQAKSHKKLHRTVSRVEEAGAAAAPEAAAPAAAQAVLNAEPAKALPARPAAQPSQVTVEFNDDRSFTVSFNYDLKKYTVTNFRARYNLQGEGAYEADCGLKLSCLVTSSLPGRNYIVTVYAVNEGVPGPLSQPLDVRSPGKDVEILVDMMPTASFAGADMTVVVDSQLSAEKDHGLTIAVDDEIGSAGHVDFVHDQLYGAMRLHFADSIGTNETYYVVSHENIHPAGPEASRYLPFRKVPIEVVEKQEITYFGLPRNIFHGETYIATLILGVPVPEGGSVTVQLHAHNYLLSEIVFTQYEAVKTFTLAVPSSAQGSFGVLRYHTVISGPSGRFYVAPSDSDVVITTKAEVTLYGLRTIASVNATYFISVILGAPVPNGRQLVVKLFSDNGFVGNVTFNPDDVVKAIPFNVGVNVGQFFLHGELGGSAASLYNKPHNIPFYARIPIRKTQMTVASMPSTIFAGTMIPITVNARYPAPDPAAEPLTLIITGSDGAQVEYTYAFNETVHDFQLFPTGEDDYAINFAVSGEGAIHYIPPPTVGLQLFDGQAIATVFGLNTEARIGTTFDLIVHLGVQVPYIGKSIPGVPDLTLTISCENGQSVNIDFAQGDITSKGKFSTGLITGEFRMFFNWGGPTSKYYNRLPFTYISVLE